MKTALALSLMAVTACQCDRGHLQTDKGQVKVPSGIDFGQEQIGQTKTLTGQVVLSNIGTAAVSVLSAQIIGTNASEFVLATNVPNSVPPGGNVTATLQFTPADGGARQAALSFVTDLGSFSVPLTGSGVLVQLCAQPPSLDFGDVQVNGTVATQTVQIVSCGKSPADLTFATPAIQGANGNDFNLSGAADQTLQPGASLTLTVAFSPSQVGPRLADIAFAPCQGCTQQQVNLSGTGVDGTLVFTPNPVGFGAQVPIGSSTTSVVTATNQGTAVLTVGNLSFKNGDPAFSIMAGGGTPISLAPGQSVQLTLRYAPTTMQGDSDQLMGAFTVADPAVPLRSATDPVDGNAGQAPCKLLVSPNSVSFGYVAVNQTGTRKVTFQNTGGTACHVTQLALSASTDPFFGLPSSAPLTIPAGTSGTVSLTFRPTAVTQPLVRRGTLDFSSDDPSLPAGTVPLVASIQNPAYAAGPWPKWHRDNGDTAQSPADTSGTTATMRWKLNIGVPPTNQYGKGTYIHSSALAQDDTVYQLGFDGSLYAVNHTTGAVVWKTAVTPPENEAQESTPTVVADGSLYLMTGGEQKTLPQFYQISSSGTVLSSTKNSDDGYDSCPGLGYDGTLYESDDDAKAIVAIKSNAIVWTGPLGCASGDYNCWIETFAGAIAPDGTSYWSGGGDAMAVSSTGTTLWTPVSLLGGSKPAGKNKAAPAFDGTNLYVTASPTASNAVTGLLYSLNPANGQTVWKFASPPVPSIANAVDYGLSSPALGVDGTIVIGFADGVYGVTQSGTQSWKVPVSAGVLSSAAIGADNTAFIGTSDGRLLAIDVGSGTLKWSFQAGGAVNSSPAIGSDGTIYFPADDGFLYALR